MKIQINDTNYSYYKLIFEIIQSHLLKLFPGEIFYNVNPIEILNKWEEENKTIAKRALKSGLQDLISQLKEFPPDLRSSINRDLAANKLPGLNELQGVTLKIISRVLKRQQIKTLEEFYIVKEEVVNLSSNLNNTDRMILDKALAEFEFSVRTTKGI